MKRIVFLALIILLTGTVVLGCATKKPVAMAAIVSSSPSGEIYPGENSLLMFAISTPKDVYVKSITISFTILIYDLEGMMEVSTVSWWKGNILIAEDHPVVEERVTFYIPADDTIRLAGNTSQVFTVKGKVEGKGILIPVLEEIILIDVNTNNFFEPEGLPLVFKSLKISP